MPDDLNAALRLTTRLPEPCRTDWETLLTATLDNPQKLSMCLLGAFSVGKSSLINMLIGQQLLPAALAETTAIPTFLEYGPAQTIRLTQGDGTVSSIDAAGLRKAATTGMDPGAFATVTLPIPWLEPFLLVDLPGTESMDSRKRSITQAQVHAADVIIYMIANRGPTQADIELLQRIKDRGKPVFLAIAKWDQVVEAHGRHQEQLPDLAQWSAEIDQATGLKANLTPCDRQGHGRDDLIAFFMNVAGSRDLIRRQRFKHDGASVLRNARGLLQEKYQVLTAVTQEQREQLSMAVLEKRQAFMDTRAQLDDEHRRQTDHIHQEGLNLKTGQMACFRKMLEPLRDQALAGQSDEEIDPAALLETANQKGRAFLSETAQKLNDLYADYGRLEAANHQLQRINIHLPRPEPVETDSLLEAAELRAMTDQVENLMRQIQEGRSQLLPSLPQDQQDELKQRIRALLAERVNIENTPVEMREQVIDSGNWGRTIGRIIGEVSDIGLMFVNPELVGAKVASLLGKGAKAVNLTVETAKVAEGVSKGVAFAKDAQMANRDFADANQKRLPAAPDMVNKLGFLEKFSLAYWGEKAGSWFDGEPERVLTADPQALAARNAAIAELERQLDHTRQAHESISREIENHQLTAYMLQSREKQLTRMQARRTSLEDRVTEARQAAEAAAQEDHCRVIALRLDEGLTRLRYSLESQIDTMIQTLNDHFKQHWQTRIQQTMAAHEARLQTMAADLDRSDQERQERSAEIEKQIQAIAAGAKQLNMTLDDNGN